MKEKEQAGKSTSASKAESLQRDFKCTFRRRDLHTDEIMTSSEEHFAKTLPAKTDEHNHQDHARVSSERLKKKEAKEKGDKETTETGEGRERKAQMRTQEANKKTESKRDGRNEEGMKANRPRTVGYGRIRPGRRRSSLKYRAETKEGKTTSEAKSSSLVRVSVSPSVVGRSSVPLHEGVVGVDTLHVAHGSKDLHRTINQA
jgi:hypothetical protein